jgi:Sulfotransferase domain
VLLTTRDVDKWVHSMNSTILHARNVPTPSRGTEGLHAVTDALWNHDFEANGVAFFHAHNQKVRDEVSKRGRVLLELDVSQTGALPTMCTFLGKQVPVGMNEFPKNDEWLAYKKEHGTGGYEKAPPSEI